MAIYRLRSKTLAILAVSLAAVMLLRGDGECRAVAQTIEVPEDVEQVVFAVREPAGPHWYENFGYFVQGPELKAYGRLGRLCKLNLVTGSLDVLLDDPAGAVRDPQVHYDGTRVLFSYRPGGTDYFHLYEIDTDGTNLRQLTEGPWDDIEPTYLPDGGIVFCSSRSKRWVPCWKGHVATLHRCERDGSQIRMVSSNIEQDNTPWVLHDGRVIYTRWEYVDRSREDFHQLWTMNPDGTSQMTCFGNMHPRHLLIDAKPIPGSTDVVAVRSPNHGQIEHQGVVVVIKTGNGPDALDALDVLTPASRFKPGVRGDRDPYALSADCFLVANGFELLVMNRRGKTSLLYRLSPSWIEEGAWIHEPRPLRARQRETSIPAKSDLTQPDGRIVVQDVYVGRNMEGIARGTIKRLLILENLPKPVNYTGSMDPISFGGSYTLNRVLGTVPVEPDGSVHARVPALRSLQLVALDENDCSVKRMLSFMTVMPGEVSSCIGCHEQRTTTHERRPVRALQRAPSTIQPIAGTPDVFDYPRDIQPVWDKYCISCHDATTYEGRVLMTGDRGPMFSHSYYSLSVHLQMADGRDLARGNYPPYCIGSGASYLLDKVDGRHYGVEVSSDELRMIKLWIDASATFPGTYAALGSGMIGPYAELQYKTKPAVDVDSWPSMVAARQVLTNRCARCHVGDMKLPATPKDTLGLRLHHLVYGEGEPRYWDPPWIRQYGDGSLRPGSLQWLRAYGDPRLRFSRHKIYNLTHPERSLQLLAPLSQKVGGLGICGDVFRHQDDPGFRVLLTAIEDAKHYLDRITRFSMPNFRPEPEYVREMIRFGTLPADFDVHADSIDVYEVDRRYWQSLWHQPATAR